MKFAILFFAVFSLSCEPSKPTDMVELNEFSRIEIPEEKASPTPEKKDETKSDQSAASIAFEKMKGDYFGEFVAEKFTKKKSPTMKNKIKFSLEKIDEKTGMIFGSSIVAGGKRPFSGTYIFRNSTFKSKLRESGDNKHDGVFEVNINAGESNIEGSWVANDEKLAVTERRFKLKKTTFKYDQNVKVAFRSFMKHLLKYRGDRPAQIDDSYYETPNLNASTQKLRAKDIENMIREDLALVRNTIYARHGYAFKTRKYRYYFEREVDWYIPFSTDVRNELTSLEKSNISLLKRYEKNATEYYDTFGR